MKVCNRQEPTNEAFGNVVGCILAERARGRGWGGEGLMGGAPPAAQCARANSSGWAAVVCFTHHPQQARC